METELLAAKAALRTRIRAALKTISAEARALASTQACARVRAQPVWKNARTVLLFAPRSEELDLWPLVAEALAGGKTMALPRFVSQTQLYVAARIQDVRTDIRTGYFNIREPAEHCVETLSGRLDLVMVPGVAFDLHGRRLGHGRGFYDRLLTGIPGLKCGVAFDEQIVGKVPSAAHDVRMDSILTPTRWIKTGVGSEFQDGG